nr:MAG TPA: hypothetical protein [Bacteriophage sp.]
MIKSLQNYSIKNSSLIMLIRRSGISSAAPEADRKEYRNVIKKSS